MFVIIFWKLSHILCLLFLLGVLISAGAAFAVSSTAAVHHGDFNTNAPILCWGTFAVSVIAMGINLFLFFILRAIENQAGDGQVKKRFQNKIIAVIVGCILNFVVVGVFAALSAMLAALASKASSDSGAIYAACAMTAIAAVMTLITIVADLVKLFSHDFEEQRNFDLAMSDA